MAGGGAVIGAIGKAGDAEQEKSQVVKNCMRGRGYRVLEESQQDDYDSPWKEAIEIMLADFMAFYFPDGSTCTSRSKAAGTLTSPSA